MTKKRKNTTGISDYELDSIARALLSAIQKLFEDEQTQKEFEEWQEERKIKLNNKKQKKNPIETNEIKPQITIERW